MPIKYMLWPYFFYSANDSDIVVVVPAPAELYADATKRFSPDFMLKQEALLTEPVTRLTLSPNHSAFALLQSRLQLVKFAFPPADEKVGTVEPPYCGQPWANILWLQYRGWLYYGGP